MNVIDLIVCLVLALALWNGWRQGFIVQVCSLAAIVLGIWLAAKYGAQVGVWMRIDARFEAAGGFAAVLVATVLAVAIAARVLRKLFHFAGFGLPDILLGIAVSVVKSQRPLKSSFVSCPMYEHEVINRLNNICVLCMINEFFNRVFIIGTRYPDHRTDRPKASGLELQTGDCHTLPESSAVLRELRDSDFQAYCPRRDHPHGASRSLPFGIGLSQSGKNRDICADRNPTS